MSNKTAKVISCPYCEVEAEVIIWEALNAQLNPEAKAALLKGEINVFRCPSCERQCPIESTLLYHDMRKKFVVWFYPFRSLFDDNETRILDSYNDDGSSTEIPVGGAHNRIAGYMANPHVVFDMNEMIRYVIFRDKLASHYSSNSHDPLDR